MWRYSVETKCHWYPHRPILTEIIDLQCLPIAMIALLMVFPKEIWTDESDSRKSTLNSNYFGTFGRKRSNFILFIYLLITIQLEIIF